MAAILKLRRGSTTPTSLEQSELFYNSTLGTIQVGKSSASNDNITLVKLTETNSGNLQIVGTISGSAVTLSGDITARNLSLSGNATIAGNITFGGELITLGDANTDNIVISGELSSSLIPNNDNAFDLGSTDKKYRDVYAYNINGSVTDIKLLNFTASQEAKDSTLATYTGSIDTKFTTLASVTGSATASIVQLFATASNHTTKFTTLGTYTGSIDDKFTTLASTTGSITASLIELFGTASNHEDRIVYLSSSFSQSVDDRLDQLEVNSGSVNNSISLLNTFSSSQESKDSTLATYTGSIDNKFTTLGTYTSSVDLDLASIHSFTSSQESKDSTLATYTASVDSDITELYSTASNHESRIDGIQDYTSSLRTAIGINGSNVTINGDLSVLGTTTQINSTQVNIGENILELNYGGSATTAGILTTDATGGSTISGSLLWDATFDYWKGGKLGNESKLLLAGGDDVVSGSDQVVESLKSTFLEINGDSVVSGSSQVDLTQTTNYSSGIKTRLNAEGVISGSAQISLAGTSDYVSAIKNRLNIESVISSSIQVDVYNTTNFTSYSQSVDSKIVQLINDSGSQAGRLDNLELFTSSQETKNSTLGTYTGSIDTKWSTLENVTSSLINATSSYETKGRDIVSGSSQLTASYDLRYANSQSFHNLVGEWDFGTQGSIRDAAFYSVTSSADVALVSGSISYNANHLLTAGATKKYVDWRTEEILTAIGAADITSVSSGNGLTGGGVTGDVTLSLDTSSVHFTNGVKTKLDTEGVISGSSQILGGSGLLSSSNETFNTFSASVDNRLDQLEIDSASQDSRLDNIELFTASIDTTYEAIASGTHTLISGSSQLDNKFINNLSGSFTGSFKGPLNGLAAQASYVITENSSTNQDYSLLFVVSGSNGFLQTYTDGLSNLLYNPSTNRLKADYIKGAIEATNGVISGSSQIVLILDPLNAFTASQETKNSTLGTYTGSIDSKFSTLATYTGSVDSSLSQLNAVSHSHSNKANLDTINQNLATTSDVTFGSFHTSGTGSIGTNLTIYGDLTVFGTQSIINSENLAVSDNMIYLNNNSEITNPDLGIVGNYNDGSYAHTGIFSDASDSQTWKVFKGYTLEPSGSIDTSHASFALADFKAANITATSFNGVINATNGVLSGSLQAQLPAGVISGSSQVNADSVTNFDSNVLAYNNSLGVVSGSSQITLSSTTGGGTSANVQFGSLGIGMAASGTSGRIDATNDIVAYSSSDRRFKDNIKPIENALDKINQIGGYEFDWKEENKIEHGYEGHDLGVIAQEIEAIAPELVQTRENGYKAVKYDKLVSVLIQAVKELSAKVSELENK